MRHRYILSTYTCTGNSLSIQFPCSQPSSHLIANTTASAPGCIAFDAVLTHSCKLKSGEDYQCFDETHVNRYDYIKIKGTVNIILALDLVLNSSDLFDYDSTVFSTPKAFWQRQLNKRIAAIMEDKSLSIADLEKVKHLISKTLDNSFSKLINVSPLTQALAKKTQSSTELLKHPYYQLVGLLDSDYQAKLAAYNKLGFIETIRTKKPEASFIGTEEELDLIPSCYLIPVNSGAMVVKPTIDGSKLPKPEDVASQGPSFGNSVSSSRRS
jgi:hypothetical protein